MTRRRMLFAEAVRLEYRKVKGYRYRLGDRSIDKELVLTHRITLYSVHQHQLEMVGRENTFRGRFRETSNRRTASLKLGFHCSVSQL
jgi:hypothetical protein